MNVQFIAASTAISQFMIIAATPIISRLYTPENFGNFSIFMSIYIPLAAIGTLKYDSSIATTKSINKARLLTAASICISLSISLTYLGIILILFMLDHIKSSNLLLIPACTFFIGLQCSLQQLSLRESKVKVYSISLICGALGNISAATLLGQLSLFREVGLELSILASTIISSLILTINTFQLRKRIDNTFITKRKVLTSLILVKSYKRYPIYVLPTYLGSIAFSSITPLMIGAYYGVSQLGLYTMASKIISMPLGVIASAFGESFRSLFFKAVREKRSPKKLWERSLLALIILGFTLFSAISFFAPYTISFILGELYISSLALFNPIALCAILSFITNPTSVIFNYARAERFLFSAYTLQGITLSSILWICSLYSNDLITALWIQSFAAIMFSVAVLAKTRIIISDPNLLVTHHSQSTHKREEQK